MTRPQVEHFWRVDLTLCGVFLLRPGRFRVAGRAERTCGIRLPKTWSQVALPHSAARAMALSPASSTLGGVAPQAWSRKARGAARAAWSTSCASHSLKAGGKSLLE